MRCAHPFYYDYRWIIISGLALLASPAMADWQLNLTQGVTPVSQHIYDLHMTIMAICAVIAVIVYGVVIFSLIRYRHSKRQGEVSTVNDHPKLEFWWTIIPFFVLLAMAYPATKTMIQMDDFDRSEVTIKITGHQWKWQYQYLDQGIDFFSHLSTPFEAIQNPGKKDPWYLLEVDRPLVVPINRKVRFLVTSNDVIHSWWVPEFGIKRDAIPGYIHEAWARISTEGTYRGQCAELCGINHGFMPIVVEAVSEEAFDAWVITSTQRDDQAAQPTQPPNWTMAIALEQGQHHYNNYCSACHGVNGKGMGALFPGLAQSSVVVSESIDRHIDLVLHGIPGSAMQAFASQLNDEVLAAIITYERNAWNNNTGDLVTPKQIAERRH